MIRFKQGSVTNPKTGDVADIVVKAISPNSIKDVVVGGSLVIAGIVYIACTAFRHGSRAYDEAEMTALCNAGLTVINGSNNTATAVGHIVTK